MPLQLTRRVGQRIFLTIDPAADLQEAVQRILKEGIEIGVAFIGDSRVYLDITAPQEVKVLREELVARDNAQRESLSQ
ncbi:carbon storage regulator [Pseudomonas sp. A-1]|uniref:carbon storage regulator n=1 Tax=Pseudomonas sp. A-1 TaxID=1821274 RepID=UPI0010A5A771|nr:carbon storage regulator [Pseudomonas sp. A-1]THG87083.1 carbon storage regulator [Pseudomonas sp. A-1]